MTLCEETCDFNGYDKETKKAICSCKVKTKLPLISDISINKEELLNNFMNISQFLNFNIMKCIEVLFSKEGIKNNFGVYIIIPIIVIHLLSVIIFYVKGYDNLKKKLNKIIDIKINKSDKNKSNDKFLKSVNLKIINKKNNHENHQKKGKEDYIENKGNKRENEINKNKEINKYKEKDMIKNKDKYIETNIIKNKIKEIKKKRKRDYSK